MNFTKNEYTFTVYSISDLLKYKKKEYNFNIENN